MSKDFSPNRKKKTLNPRKKAEGKSDKSFVANTTSKGKKESKNAAVSGAPITVTGVAQDTGGKGIILLKIDVSNAGEGDSTIIGKDFDKAGRFDQISYEIDEPEKWKCSSGGRENEARLIDGKAQVICKLKKPLTEDELYTKPVRLTLDYTYKELLLKKLRVKESAK